MKKAIATLAAFAICASVLAGCAAPTSSSTPAQTSSTPAASASTDAGTGEPVVLELFYQKPNHEVVQKIIDMFEVENPGIEIEMNVITSDAGKQAFQTRMATNQPMDLLQHWPSQAEFRQLAEEGRFVDLSGEAFLSNVMDGPLELSKVDGKVMSVPLSVNTAGIIYNKTMFKDNNLEVPKTWAELINVCETLQKNGITPMIFDNGSKSSVSQKAHILSSSVSDKTWNAYDTYVGIHTGSGKNVADDEKTKLIAERLLELNKYAQKDSFGADGSTAVNAFSNGEGAMMINGTWMQVTIEENNPDLDFGFFPIPNTDGPTGIISGIDPCFAALKGAKHEAEAVKFLEFLCRPEINQIYIDAEKAPSAIKGVTVDNETIAPMLDVIENGTCIPWWRDYLAAGVYTYEDDLVQELVMNKDVNKYVTGLQDILLQK